MYQLHPQLKKDTFHVISLTLCDVLLSNDSQYPWLILVPRLANITEIYQLSESQQQQLIRESSQVSELMQRLFQADKMNVAALGNQVPQLHLHHIARFKEDLAWPRPVWGVAPATAYDESVLEQRLNLLRQGLSEFT